MSPRRRSKPSMPPIHRLFLLPLLAASCAPVPWPASEPDLAAIATVVKDVYRAEGQQRRIIFLEMEEDTLAQAQDLLETDLGVTIRPESEADRTDASLPALTPVLSETGDIGISISLGRFRVDDDGNLRVMVSYARSGLDGADLEYVLEANGQGWRIINRISHGVA